MATLKERPDNWAAGGIYRRDFRHDKSDGYEETPHKSKHGKPKASSKHVGCPGNNDGAHVYVWTKEIFADTHRRYHGLWGYFYWLGEYEYKVCAGCHKHKSARRRKGVAPLR